MTGGTAIFFSYTPSLHHLVQYSKQKYQFWVPVLIRCPKREKESVKAEALRAPLPERSAMLNTDKNKLIWKTFYLLLIVIFINIAVTFLGFQIDSNILFKLLFLGLPVILLLLHSFQTLSFTRGVFFIILASITGLLMEMWGLKDGVIFGGNYVYKQNQLTLFSVPLSVVLYWAVFIYTGYCLINSFLVWFEKKKPNIRQHNLWVVPLLIIADGLLVVAIDLFMDPIQVYKGSWIWLDGGPYFGIPIGNFVGWFLVTIIVTGLFRSYEYFKPKEQEFDKSIYVIPVLGYGILSLSFALTAMRYQMINLMIFGILLMMPTVILNVIFFRRYQYIKMLGESRVKIARAKNNPSVNSGQTEAWRLYTERSRRPPTTLVPIGKARLFHPSEEYKGV